MIDHGQPIDQWADEQEGLTAEDRAALLTLIHIRTVGDLEGVLSRRELSDQALAIKLGNILGIIEIETPTMRISARGMERVDKLK